MDDTKRKRKASGTIATPPRDRHRSRQDLTPNNSTDRELKKLEDYWTRQNPVIDDSPRLRSKRKGNVDIHENLPNNTPCLPESPLVIARDKLSENNNVKETPLPESCTLPIIGAHFEISQDSDTSDSDDDDYIPPRKKLRSEVTKDELWEGIPLTVSFKRLAPISKRTSECSSDNAGIEQVSEHEESNENGVYVVENFEARSNLDKQTNHTESSIVDQERNDAIHIEYTDTPSTSQQVYNNIYNPTENRTFESEKTTCEIQSPSALLACHTTLSQILIPDNETIAGDIENQQEYIELSRKDEVVSSSSSNSNIQLKTDTTSKTNDVPVVSENVRYEQNEPGESKKLKSINTPVRRSRRLSDNDRRRSEQNTPAKPVTISTTIHEEVESRVTDSEPSLVDDRPTEVKSSQKLTFGPIKLNKPTKTIPPLRIRLKQPGNGKKKNQNSVEKYDHVSDDVSSSTSNKKENKTINDNNKTKKNSKQNELVESDSKCSDKGSKKNKDAEKRKKKTKSNTMPDDDEYKPTTSKKEEESQKKKYYKKKSGVKNEEKSSQIKDCLKKKDVKKKNKPSKSDKGVASRSPSPSTNDKMELRLNNVRRISAASELMSNNLLNKHACVLWSSENRRYVQLSNPHATAATLDDILIKKWNKLSDREKMRYFQRARDALKEENRHSNRRAEVKPSGDEQQTTSSGLGIESFQALPPNSQMVEIKKWLNLYHGISPAHCASVISSFKVCLNEENIERDAKQQEKNKQKSKTKKSKRQKKSEDEPEVMDSSSRYRKLLYSKILDNKRTFIDLLVEQKKAWGEQILQNFSRLVKQLIRGEVVHFAGDVRSDKLTEILYDLRSLERENKLNVTGDDRPGDDIEVIVTCLHDCDSYEDSLLDSLENINVDYHNVEELCMKIETIPTLDTDAITRLLSEADDTVMPCENNMLAPTRPESDSPVTLLTDWVADDVLSRQPQICFRRAVSLLSNKVVPSPTLIMSQSANSAQNGSNRNKSCNVMFTQIKNNEDNTTRHERVGS